MTNQEQLQKERELFLRLKTAIASEIEQRETDNLNKDDFMRYSPVSDRYFRIDEDRAAEDAREDAVSGFIDDIDHAAPKLYEVIWDIMQEMRIC